MLKAIRVLSILSVIAAVACASRVDERGEPAGSPTASNAAPGYLAALNAVLPASESSGNVSEIR